jgi:HK97 family phage portal protein
MKLGSWLYEKLNPGQRWISYMEPQSPTTEPEVTYTQYYEQLETVNRAINMIIDDTSEINFKLGSEKVGMPQVVGAKRKTVESLLNIQPNPFQDINAFRRNLLMDFMLDGNAFLYYDGAHLYHMPAKYMTINSDTKTYIEKYVFQGTIDFSPNEIIHVKDNSAKSIYRGSSRLGPALRTMKLMRSMRDFQDNFFKNGAVPGLVIKSPNVLSPRIKERMKEDWKISYKPQSGGRNPLILDGGMEIDSISNVNFKDLDFTTSIDSNENIILKAIGIPPVLMDSGNNANLRPNHRLYYLETIIPIIKKFNSAYQMFFGFQIKEDVAGIPALQPELRDEAAFYSTLVNGGILTANEAREGLGLSTLEGHDELRIPQNIAGSAADPSVGGRPTTQSE